MPASVAAIDKGFLSEQDAAKLDQEAWLLMLPKRLGDYQLVRLLGRGGMSAVFEARDVSLQKTVAVKVLMPQFAMNRTYLTRFRREAALAAKPTHPNTVQVFHYGQQDDVHFLVMEYVEGPSVASMVRSQGSMDETEALDIAIRVARSLGQANEYGIIHRDVKPANIKVSKWGSVKLMDFGVAKLKGSLTDTTSKGSITMGVVGTPNYMSPEQAQGLKDIDFRTDMYSLGATLYHMLSGVPPYEGLGPQDVLQQIASSPPRPIRSLRRDLGEFTCRTVERLMARSPQARFDSFAELIGAMEAARDQAAREDEPPVDDTAPTEGFDVPNWPRTLAIAAAIVAVGILIFFGLNALRGCRADAPSPPSPQATP